MDWEFWQIALAGAAGIIIATVALAGFRETRKWFVPWIKRVWGVAIVGAAGGAVAVFFLTPFLEGPPGVPGAAQLPRGFVVAFAGLGCPPDWEPFADAEGRFIIGTNEDRQISEVETGYVFPKGGDDPVFLEPRHLPNHTVRLDQHVMMHGRFVDGGVPPEDHYIAARGSDFTNDIVFVRAGRLGEIRDREELVEVTYENREGPEERELKIEPPRVCRRL